MKYWLTAVSSAVSTSLSRSMISGVDCNASAPGSLSRIAGHSTDGLEGLEQLDRDGEDDRGIAFGRDLHHGLELAELEGAGGAGDHRGRLAELLRGLQLALGGDDLGPPFPLRLGLPGHGPLHLLREADVADLDPVDLDAPRLRLGVEADLQLAVDPLPLRQQLVELVAAHDGPQRRLGHQLARGVPVADPHHRGGGVDHLEVGDGVDRDGHVVPGDDGLRRHRGGDDLQVDLGDPVEDGEHEEDPRAAGADAAPEAEDHPPLVLLDDLDRRRQEQDDDGGEHDAGAQDGLHGGSFVGGGRGLAANRSYQGWTGAGMIHSTMRSWPTTTTSSPAKSGTSAVAFHSDPSRRTVPRPPSHCTTVARRPSRASIPTWGGRSSRRTAARSSRGKPAASPTVAPAPTATAAPLPAAAPNPTDPTA